MTIQVALANGHCIAMASDRHVFRGGETRSTGQDVKLHTLAGPVPAALMAAGPFALADMPVSRLALRIERALADAAPAGAGPEALADAVLRAIEQPVLPDAAGSDALVLARLADEVLAPVLAAGGDARADLHSLLRDIERAPFCRGGERVERSVREAWPERAEGLSRIVTKPVVAAALDTVPDLCGRAVIGALARDWLKAGDVHLTVGLVCPATAIPVLIALRLWRGIGNRLHIASRLDGDYECLARANRTVVVAQGTGRAVIEAMVDGIAEDHWSRLPAAQHDRLQPAMTARWDKAHDRIGVSSGRELASVAGGLVRGAEVIGYLTRDSEGTVADIDCVVLGARGAARTVLEAGPDLRRAA